MNQSEVVKKMNEMKSQTRGGTLGMVKAVKGMADAQTIKAAAIEFHCAEYRCKSMPADTLGFIEAELGIGRVVAKESAPFNQNW